MRSQRKGTFYWSPSLLVPWMMAIASACDQGAHTDSASAGPEQTLPPRPRWVLADKAGARVQALVEPSCGHYDFSATVLDRCIPPELGSNGAFPCARVIFFEDKYVNFEYELATGLLGPCSGFVNGLSFDWLDDQCSGPRFHRVVDSDGSVFRLDRETRDLIKIDEGFFYVSTTDCPGNKVPSWKLWNNECFPVAEADRGVLCPVQPVPEWVTSLLPNPPYTLQLVYE